MNTEALADHLGASVRIDADSSGGVVCTYEVEGQGGPYFVAVRLEDGFESLDAVRGVFPEGRPVEGFADEAYWSPQVTTLWFEHSGSLHAVQLVQFPGTSEEAMNIAVSVAELAVGAS